jgi:lipopolysaccharide transport system ATP-binding protein
MSDTIIKVENLGKKYLIPHEGKERYTALRDVITNNVKGFFKSQKQRLIAGDEEEFWALKDINFEIKQGEAVGIIGRNGAGKSTLLKILSRITEPSTGRITINGRVASLLEVGTGFHPELTGRENIYLNGAILGMSRAEIKKKFDEIVDFSGVEKFLDTPVKRYSSGMYVRLAFAIAAHLEPEILVVDEVLAVGDAEFQKKCLGKMDDVAKKEGRTVLFVSHNMEAVQSLCKQGIFLKNGSINFLGSTEQCVNTYLSNISNDQILHFKPLIPIKENGFSIMESFVSTRIYGNGVISNATQLDIHFRFINHELKKFSAYMFVYRNETLAFIASDLHNPCSDKTYDQNISEIIFSIPKYILNPGNCTIGLMIADYNGNSEQFIHCMNLLSFNVEDDGFRRGNKYNLGWSGAVSPILNVKTKSN